MSLVVAYKRNGVVYMGADTQTSTGTSIVRRLNESGFKITRLDNGIFVGACGRAKGHQMIIAQKRWFALPEGETLNKRYIVKNIVPKLSALTKSLSDDNTTCTMSMSMSVLLVQKDKMFVITKGFEVFECEHFVAIGAGRESCHYELTQIGEEDDVNEGLLKALRAGARFNSTISAPYILIDTQDKQYKIVEE